MYKSSTFRTSFLLTAAVALVFVSTAALVWHLELTDSFPKADQKLAESPDSILLWFSQAPDLALAAIDIEGENGAVEMGKPQATSDPKSIKALVLGVLEPGAYRVNWRAAGSDGHAMRGGYDFEVRASMSERIRVER